MKSILNYLFLAVLMASVKIAAAGRKLKGGSSGTGTAPEADYIAGLVLSNNINSNACDEQESLDIQAQFTQAAVVAAETYPGPTRTRRKLTDQNHRALPNCPLLCQGFPPGQCWMAYPGCLGYRRLEQETPIDYKGSEGNTENAAASVPSTSFRGEQRKLSFSPADYVDATGFYNAVSVDAGSYEYCAYLRSKVSDAKSNMSSLVSLSQSCEQKISDLYTIGCVWV